MDTFYVKVSLVPSLFVIRPEKIDHHISIAVLKTSINPFDLIVPRTIRKNEFLFRSRRRLTRTISVARFDSLPLPFSRQSVFFVVVVGGVLVLETPCDFAMRFIFPPIVS